MITVVYIVPNVMTRGGIESFLISYFLHFDHKKIRCVFCQLGDNKGAFDEVIVSNGGFVEYVSSSAKTLKHYKKEFKRIIEKYNPDVFHINGDADCCKIIMALRKLRVKKIISHSHNTGTLSTKFVLLKRLYTRFFTKYHFACSKKAGEWLFGKSGKFSIINNAIDINSFAFRYDYRKMIRYNLNIPEDALVVGNVAHLIQNHKNQLFLIRVFERIFEINKNSFLVLVGDGMDENTLKSVARKTAAHDHILFLGMRSDVNELYSSFDVFCLPSFFEGLGIVVVEATSSGLHSLISDKVPLIDSFTEVCHQLPIIDGAEKEWCDYIIRFSTKRNTEGPHLVQRAGFDILIEANKLLAIYEEIKND